MCTQAVKISTRDRNLERLPNVHTRCPILHTGKGNLARFPNMHTRGVTQDEIGESARLPNVHTRCPTLNTGKAVWQISECAHKRSNSQHGIGNFARLPNRHTRCPTLHTGKAIWQDFRLCTQEVKISTRDRIVGGTCECAHKMSNSHHRIGNLARHPNVHKRCPNLHTG
ncbi:dynein heavy chain [Plakobranchus ocellatus]|uniref:Dynein heavy chain n=1 Tax=Plakobranchus ocellatus TaxID=259542 RepID=A0AAV4B295_9GAST|nr:dynein heavy chain [Plakobranchus ocellatus]